jgi:hypothetical protein
MALLTVQQITKAGLAPSYTAVSASDTIPVDSVGMFLHDSGTTAGGSAATDPTVSVPATTGDRMIYLPPQFVNTATGLLTVTHGFTTSVTCAVLRVV